jgi:hypothetical protein
MKLKIELYLNLKKGDRLLFPEVVKKVACPHFCLVLFYRGKWETASIFML